jgi:hypothetical protein
MSATVAGAVYAIAGFSSPFALVPKIANPLFLVRCFAVWLLTAMLLFFLDDYLTVLLLAGVILAVLAPPDPIDRICFFFVAAPCLPVYLQVYLPFPGINWLVLLTYYKVVSFVVLVPILFKQKPVGDRQVGFTIADTSVVIYTIVTVLLVTGVMGPTAGPRFLIDQLLLLVIPYFILSRMVRSQADLELCFRSILLVSLILAAIAILATLKQWDFYRLKEPASVFSIPDVRSGLVRIAATANTHSLGYHLAIGILFLEYLKSALGLGRLRLWLFRGMLFAGLLSTNSRGALLALVVAFGVYFVVTLRSAALRRLLLVAFVCAAAAGTFWLLTTDDASQLDPYNSVGYRQLLLKISVAHILEHPLIGDLNFLADGKFAPLLQGQGIIDITNLYLQIGLYFGITGLVLFAGIFIPTLRNLMRLVVRPRVSQAEDREKIRKMSGLVSAGVVGWSVLVATTSDVGLTLHLGLMLIALARAITRFEAPQLAPVEQRRVNQSVSLRAHASRILQTPTTRTN